MGLLDLPTELRIQILEHLPDLSYGRHETVGPNVRITPAICRVSRVLREDALPIYAKTSSFIIQTDDCLNVINNRVQVWLQALGDVALSHVENLQLSRHWKIPRPSRWQGHVGFYVRLQLVDGAWQCTTGTYPIVNDMRGMRLESVDLLRHTVVQRLSQLSGSPGERGLSRADVECIVDAMDVVASHPISTFDTEQSEAGRRRRRGLWAEMEGQLFALGETAPNRDAPSFDPTGRRFYTPY